MNNKASPIFIHSLFRSGSTYLFNVFRRAPGYTAYQEPLNPELSFATTEPEKLLVHHHETSKLLRHPDIDKPYFYEFYLLKEEVGRLFHKEFSYDQFFISEIDDVSELKAYFSALIEGAQGRPVFQCCRSTGRAKRCRTECGGTHLFLWRNPWDQWWSYRIGFDVHNLLIANAANPPGFLKRLKKDLQLPEFHDANVFQEYAYYKKCSMDSQRSYTLFYALWCHAMLEAMPVSDVSINIDRLGTSREHRDDILSQLASHGIQGLDFSDCETPQGVYGKVDKEFFGQIEENVHALLVESGYSQTAIEKIQQIRSENMVTLEPLKVQEAAIRDASRARQIVRHYESKLHQEYLSDEQYISALAEKDAECYRLNVHLQARADQIKQYDTWLKEAQTELRSTQAVLQTTQADLQAAWLELEKIKSSFFYKVAKRLGIF